jgi:hypothetical protein
VIAEETPKAAIGVAKKFAYVPLSGSPDPGISRASLVRSRRFYSQ